MTKMKYRLSIFIFFLIFTACSSHPTNEVSSVMDTVTFTPGLIASQTMQPYETQTPPLTVTDGNRQTSVTKISSTRNVEAQITATIVALIPSATSVPTRTPRLTVTETLIPPTIPVATLNAAATLVALGDLCDEFEPDSSRYSEISPDGMWFFISCGYSGYKRDQMLIVLSREGTKWLIDFTDFLNPELEGMMGRFEPLAWSVDGRFLYFTKILGWDSGGNQCFPGIGVFGLYRLHLRTGNLTTLVSSDDFSGNEIRFSPTKEYYAVAGDGIKITNLINGKITAINNSGVIAMSWSPDGKYLAFSVASCGEILVESSSIFVWDSKMDQTKALYTTEEMLLRPISWIDNSNLRFEGEKWDGNNNYYNIFEYALAEDRMLFSGTETPQP